MSWSEAVYELIYPTNPIARLMWLLIGAMLGWLFRDWWLRRQK